MSRERTMVIAAVVVAAALIGGTVVYMNSGHETPVAAKTEQPAPSAPQPAPAAAQPAVPATPATPAAPQPAASTPAATPAPAATPGTAWNFKKFPLDMAMGSESAPVTILEYSSLVCSHCAAFHANTLPKLKQAYIDTGKVRLIARDFPLGQLGLVAAVFPHCAGPDRYFGLTDVLFNSQQTWGMARDPYDELLKIGRLAGLSKDKVEACMKDQTLLNGIESVAKDAEQTYGIDSTPTFIVNGRKLIGDQPWEEFQKAIEAALAAAKG